MTFEASRKKQLLVLQPKGKPLYNDSNSFGLKMLQSMGWKKGNGLGRNQQGDLNFIQVRYKNNSNGLGFDGLKDNQWTETESSFDSLLKNLNSQSNSNSSDEIEQKKPTRSLEEISKKSKARVHYKKFTKGKDVYKYSEKDLANILGKKSLKEEETKKEDTEENSIETERPDTYESDLIVNTGVSITDYFKQKKQEKAEKSTNLHQVTKDSWKTEISENRPELNEKAKKKKKKNKSEKEKEEPEKIQMDEMVDEANVISSKKKKKSKKYEEQEPKYEVEQEIRKKKKKSKKERVEEIEEIVPKKKKKKTCSDPQSEETPVSTKSKFSSLQTNKQNDVDRPKGNNTLYKIDTILISSHVAQKMSNVSINNFNNSNLGNIIGYGMAEDIELKVVETKMGNKINNDKYALYNMDKIEKTKVNPRRILTKIKKTKKSIQVI